MRVIHKYEIQPNAVMGDLYRMVVTSHLDARPLSVAVVNGRCFMWAEVDPALPLDTINLVSVGTGCGEPPDEAVSKFIGTVVQGLYVWHIYWLPSHYTTRPRS